MDYFGIFAKYWEPGKVKTRLARSIGPKNACDVYFAMLNHLISTLESTADHRVIAYSPVNKASEFSVFSRWQQTPQSDGPLGTRMAHFFKQAFSRGAKRVVLTGSDCPDVTPATLASAFAALDETDVVLGPTFDGGYYLVGMSLQFHDLFSNITFSTDTVLTETIVLTQRNHISCRLLERLNDIDEVDDLNQYVVQLSRKQASGTASSIELDLLDKLKELFKRPQMPELNLASSPDRPAGETS